MAEKQCSIIIPSHNRPALILNAVNSALANCTPDGEVIVVDDRSTIAVQDVLAGVSDKRLKVIRNTQAFGGAAYARNLGIAAASHELVFFLDDDDIFIENYIHHVLAEPTLDQADYGFGKDYLAADSQSFNVNLGFELVNSKADLKKRLAGAGAGFWVRRQAFLALQGFDTQQVVDEDTDLCVRLTVVGANCLVYKGFATAVYRVFDPAKDIRETIPQLTSITQEQIALACYQRTFDKSAAQLAPFTNGVWYLGERYIRRAVNAGYWQEAFAFCMRQQSWLMKCKMLLFYYKKRISFSIKRKKSKV